MDRIKPVKFRWDRVDAMLVSALAVVLSSYALGYKLDWSHLDQPESRVSQGPEIPVSQAIAANDEEPAEDEKSDPAQDPIPVAQALTAAAIKPAPALPGQPAMSAAQPELKPDPRETAWREMTGELERMAGRHRGRVAIFVRDLKDNRTWAYHENDLFPSASLIKVPIMAAAFAKIKDGELSLHERLTLRRHNRVGGSGSLKWSPDGTRLTIAEILQRMIGESDNTATAMIIERVGLGYIQRQFPQFGLLYTGIYQEGMSIKSGRVQNENYTTAREMTMLMEKIYKGELIDRPSSQLMLEILKHKKAVASRLAKGLPRNWEIAHKTGLLRNACHDVAIIMTPNGDYAITVLTGSNQSYKVAKDFISRLGRVTYTHYGGYPRYAARRKGGRQVARR